LPSVRWGVDLRFWRPSDRSTDMICCVGREMRDYATLVEAVRHAGIPCHIAAGGLRAVPNPWLTGLSAEMPTNVTIGGKRGIELRDLYDRSRFTVVPLLPSDTDNGITAILESFAMAKPVICTSTPGQIGVVQDGVNGLLVPPGSPEAMRSAILRLWRDPAECERMGRNGRRLVEEQHNYEQWVSALTGGLGHDDDRFCA
jgi:glycosyltransferase involved in cell wall biosynthesis